MANMGAYRYLASLRARIVISGVFLLMTQQVMAATYGTRSFFLTGSFSFDVISPSELNALTGGTANIPGLMGGRLTVERGLFSPDWTHWIEFGYFKGGAEASAEAGAFDHSISYMAIIPLGVSYWFLRSAFIDFGLGAGVGFGLAPSYTLISTPATGGTDATTQNFKGKIGPVFAARVEARFWFSKSFAATFASGLHIFSSELTTSDAPATTVPGALTGLSIMGGLTYAFGGVQGTGRTYVEVIRDKPDVRPATKAPAAKHPVANPSARPRSAAPPKPAH
jgi:hypothetical protein